MVCPAHCLLPPCPCEPCLIFLRWCSCLFLLLIHPRSAGDKLASQCQFLGLGFFFSGAIREGRIWITFDMVHKASEPGTSLQVFAIALCLASENITGRREMLLYLKAGCATGLYQRELINVKG